MTFTKELPTKPGFYVWRKFDGDAIRSLFVDMWSGPTVVILDSHGAVEAIHVTKMGGEWCRLVPAEEIRKAYLEGSSNMANFNRSLENLWHESRAKRVMEGEE